MTWNSWKVLYLYAGALCALAAASCGRDHTAAHSDDDGPPCNGRRCDDGGSPGDTAVPDDVAPPPDDATDDAGPPRRPCDSHEDCLPFEMACGDDGFCFCPYKDPSAPTCSIDLCDAQRECPEGTACWGQFWVCGGPTCGYGPPIPDVGYRCDTLDDCPYGWICYTGYALCIPGGDDYPVDAACNDPPCKNDSQCTHGRTCQNYWCRLPTEPPPNDECMTVDDCPPRCDCLGTKDGTRCVPWPTPPPWAGKPCLTTAQCPYWYTCQEVHHRRICVPSGDNPPPGGNDGGPSDGGGPGGDGGTPCEIDGDCSAPLVCGETPNGKRCEPPGPPCETDNDCCNGQTCQNGYCQDPPPSGDGGPGPGSDGGGGPGSDSGSPGDTNDGAPDCPPGNDGGGDVPSGGGCEDDRDCPRDQTCYHKPCDDDETCNSEGTCVEAPGCETVDYHGSLDGRCHGHYPNGGVRPPGQMTGHMKHCRCPRTHGNASP